MQFNSPITKVEFIGGKYLLALAEDSAAQLCDLETMKAKSFSEIGHIGAVRNASIDPNVEVLASVGCDGKLFMINIKDMKVFKKLQIAEKTQNFNAQCLPLKWSPDGQ